MHQELRKRAASGAFWSSVDALGARLVQFIIGIILARLLSPEEFGLVAIVTVFIAVAQACVDGGFAVSLIQQKHISPIDCSSVFFANLATGFVFAVILCAIAPLVADFYHQPALAELAQVLSAVVVISAFGRVHAALLTRKIDFRTQAKVTLASSLISGAAGITLALQGYGAWSLVWQQITAAIARSALFWILHEWRPGLHFSLAPLRRMSRFGSRMLASTLLNQIFNNLYELVIAKSFGAVDLGYYNRSYRLQALPGQTFSTMITRVSLPVFSSLQDQPARLQSSMRSFIQVAMFLNAPVMAGLAAAAPEIVTILLTEKWLPCVPLLQILCINGMLHPLHAINLNAVIAHGRSDIFLRLEIIKKALVVVNIALTFRHGIHAMLVGQAMVTILCYFLNNLPVSRIISYPARKQIVDILPQLGMAGAMALIVLLVPVFTTLPTGLRLALQIALGSFSYIGLSALFRVSALGQVAGLFRARGFSVPPAASPSRESSPTSQPEATCRD